MNIFSLLIVDSLSDTVFGYTVLYASIPATLTVYNSTNDNNIEYCFYGTK